MSYDERNDAISLICKANMMLDRLQVELCKDTPYEIPDAESTRERILKAMDIYDKLYNLLENVKVTED